MNTLFKPEEISTLCLGIQGENKAKIIQIDVSDWLNEYPTATINILVTRPNETTPYIANTSVSNGVFSWLITDSDTTYSGIGRAELRATQGNIIKKSLTYLTSIKESLEGVPSPLPPEPSESWVNSVIEKANEVLNSRVESFNINEQGHLIATLEDGTTQDLGNVVGSGKVSSVNGKTGTVILTANDLNAYTKTEVNTELAKKQDILTDFSQSGDYTFFHNKVDFTSKVPTCNIVPTTGEHLTNKEYVDTAIPTQTSQLTNNSGFITNAVNNLVNYYLKTETYTKTEVNNLISAISTISLQVVQTLPTEDIQTNVIYLVPRADSETGNIYDEYIYVSNAWEKIGSTDVDLTGYATETWVSQQIAGFLTQSQIEGLISTALGNYYTKSEVNTALGNKENISNKVTSLSASSTDTQYPSAKCVYDGLANKVDKEAGKGLFSGSYTDLTNKPTIPTVDQTYDGTSANAQSGVAVASAISGKLDASKVKSAQSTTSGDVYDVTYINTMLGNVETLLQELRGNSV